MSSPTQPHLTLILGGARSGKSTFAEKLGGQYTRVTYLATAQASDDEMVERIAKHRSERPAHWQTVECPFDPASAIRTTRNQADCYLLDCITILVANLLLSNEATAEATTHTAISGMLSAFRETQADLLLVSNEVGLGLVPDNPLGRRYRDLLGRVNQQLTAQADTVYFLVAGLPMKIKP